MTDPRIDKGFEDFVSKSEDGFRPNEKVLATKKKLEGTLVPSASKIAKRYVGISVVGYLVSLSICSQNGIGFFSFSQKVAAIIHSATAPFSEISCGVLFSAVPFLLSLLVLNRFEQRYLLTKMVWLVALLPAIAAILMQALPSFLGETPEHSGLHAIAWVAGATIAPYFLDLFVFLILKQRPLKASLLKGRHY